MPLLRLPGPNYAVPSRGIGMVIARVLRGALKIRYLILGGSIAGGSALAKVNNVVYYIMVLFNYRK